MCYNIENRRYTGSKAKLTDWIMSLIEEHCNGTSFCDIFGGTGIVASVASKKFKKIIVNDLLYSNYVIYNGFFNCKNFDLNKLSKIIFDLNSIDVSKIKENYFSKNFGDKYFTKEVSIKIGEIRDKIEEIRNEIGEENYFVILSSLIYSIDRIANTVGHYDAYIKKNIRNNDFILNLITPNQIKDLKIFREDANELAKNITTDIVYIDPPYNSRQYSRFYHLLETLVKWDKPTLTGTAMKPEPENMSEYCKVKAPDAFADLIEKLKCKYIVVSYNNTYNSKSNSSKNKITLEQIEEILNKKGKTKVFRKNHKHFNAGKTNFDNHQEYIFITKVKNGE